MRILLLLGLVCLPFAFVAGDGIDCYINAETKSRVIKTKHQACPNLCMKLEKVLADGTVVVARGCGRFRWDESSAPFLEDLNLTSSQKETLLASAPDSMHFCDEDFCNGVDSVIPSYLLISLIAVSSYAVIT